MKNIKNKAHNCHIHPVLYDFYLGLKKSLGAAIVHRRKRRSNNYIEVVFYCDLFEYIKGRLNTLKEAEKWGYWVICRMQTKRGHEVYHGRRVYQLYLSPVHPKKRREALYYAEKAEEVTFSPIVSGTHKQRSRSSYVHYTWYGDI